MRLLHTSDWHLGRRFHGTSLLDEQAEMVDRVVELADAEQVDAVVIAGDLYDRAIPATPAVELLDEALLRLRDTGAVVIAISGNHDSAIRTGFGDRILGRAGVTVRTDVRRHAEAVLVADGDQPPVAVYPVPYLDPVTFEAANGAEGPTTETEAGIEGDGEGPPTRRSHHETFVRAMRSVQRDRRRHGLRSVVVAHAFVAGAAPRLDEAPVEECDSERPLAVGDADRVEPGVFGGIDYVALGHLHGHQSWDGERLAYSGSPLRYSFSEEHHRKGVRVVDIGSDGSRSVEVVELAVGRPLHTLSGPLDELLVDPLHVAHESDRIRAVITDAHLPHQAMARLRSRFPHAAELVHQPPERTVPVPTRSAQDVRRRQPLDLTFEFLAEHWDREVDAASRALVREAVTSVIGVQG